jgi:hypothetical protein
MIKHKERISMKTITIISLILIICGCLMFAMAKIFWMIILAVVLILLGLGLLFSYILGDRKEKGFINTEGKTALHTNTQFQVDALRNDLRLVNGIEEKIQLISRCNFTECALAAQDMLNEDLPYAERYRNAHLLVDRRLISQDELNQFKSKHH